MTETPASGAYSFAMKRAKMLVLIALAVLFVIAGVGLFLNALTADPDQWNRNRIAMLVVGPTAVVFFGYGVISLTRRFIRTGKLPGLELTPEGFIDRTTGASPSGLVPWSEVRQFTFLAQQRQNYLALELVDPERFRQYLGDSKLKQTAYSANLRLLGPVHPIHLNTLKANPDELAAAVTAVTGGRVSRGFGA